MTRLLVLAEGQSEEKFVKDVLAPFLEKRNIFVSATILSNGGEQRGGVSTWSKIKKHCRS